MCLICGDNMDRWTKKQTNISHLTDGNLHYGIKTCLWIVYIGRDGLIFSLSGEFGYILSER